MASVRFRVRGCRVDRPVTDLAETGGAPVIDVSRPVSEVAAAVDDACSTTGFFAVTGHGVEPERLNALRSLASEFFALPERDKELISMRHGGRAWRGWFPLGDELTGGVPDQKEGLYFGAESEPSDPRVLSGTALHGANLFPEHPAALRAAVLGWMASMEALGQRILSAMAVALGQDRRWFRTGLCADPTVLFRIFRYPPVASPPVGGAGWGVAEHTDYGLVTILATDDVPGLEIRTPAGVWIPVTPPPGAFVCNVGDMLERVSRQRWRSTPHRVANRADGDRYSFPFFLDPSWDALIPDVDGTAVHYGEHLVAKVSRVFPELMASVAGRKVPEPGRSTE